MAERMSKRVFDGCKTLTRTVCVKMLTGIGQEIDSYASQEEMQMHVYSACIVGDLHPRDILGSAY